MIKKGEIGLYFYLLFWKFFGILEKFGKREKKKENQGKMCR
jgi:hypothetical protein